MNEKIFFFRTHFFPYMQEIKRTFSFDYHQPQVFHNGMASQNVIIRVEFWRQTTASDEASCFATMHWLLRVLRRALTYPTEWEMAWHDISEEKSAHVEFLFRHKNPKYAGYGTLCLLPPFDAKDSISSQKIAEMLAVQKELKKSTQSTSVLSLVHAVGVSGVPDAFWDQRWESVMSKEHVYFTADCDDTISACELDK